MPRKSPAGATFVATDRPIYFLAVGSPLEYILPFHRHLLVAVDQVTATTRHAILTAPPDAKIFLDSGIFVLVQDHMRAHGGTMEQALALAPEAIDGFDALFTKYCAAVETLGPALWGYTELDQGGAAHKRRTRARLEALGYAPIPVYHPLNDGWDYFDELASTYDRIAIGNLVHAAAPVRLRVIATLHERLQAYPPTWLHLLGVTPSPMLLAYPHASADSSSWYNVLRGWHWIQETASNARLGSLADDARGKTVILTSKATPTAWAEVVALAAYVAHHLEQNWRAAVTEGAC